MSMAFDYNAPLPPRNGAPASEWATYRELTGTRLLAPPLVLLRAKGHLSKLEAKADKHVFVPFCLPPPMGGVEYEEPIRMSPHPSLRQIIGAVASAFDLENDEVLVKRRTKSVVLARHVAMFLAIEMTSFSYPQIGERMGFDHSTVIYAHRCIAARLLDDSAFSERVSSIRRSLSGDANPLRRELGEKSYFD